MDLLLEIIEERLDLGALVASMPGLRHILEICLWKAVVAVMPQEASNRHPITKLNSWFELTRGPVD